MRVLFVLPVLLCASPALASGDKPAKESPVIIATSWSLTTHKPSPHRQRMPLVLTERSWPSTDRSFRYDLGDGWTGGLIRWHSGRHSRGHSGIGARLRF
jgi:hypothetical protein